MMWLSILISASAIAHIVADSLGLRRLCFITKPLTMLLIIGLLLSSPQFFASPLRMYVLIGILFSLVGDIFLLWPEKRFIPGLLSFLVSHLFYAYGFWEQSGALSPLPLVFLLPLSLMFLSLLWNHLGALRIPVLIYSATIAFMMVCASSWFYFQPTLSSYYAAVGAALFIISDACLAWRKFRGTFALASLCVMGTYYGAQWLIVLSAR